MKHLLIVGAGSVGKRHAQNLLEMGCKVSCVDPRIDRCEELSKTILVENSFSCLDLALEDGGQFSGAVICSPPSFHVDQCISLLEKGISILLEKPISPDMESASRLLDISKNQDASVLLGYTFRWWEPLRHVNKLLKSGILGDLHHIYFVMSAHLADWHPWEDYREFFMASRELGGGALLDESHWIDIMLWFFGLPKDVYARIEKLSSLEIDSDDNVDMIFEYEDNKRITMHLDLYGRPHEKHIKFVGEKGTMIWSVDPNETAYCTSESEINWVKKTYCCERNDMFKEVALEFLDILDGNKSPTCSLEDGLNVLKVIEAARESSFLKKRVDIVR
ncbi:Gfo/Idh/MocA family oxidoreductase [Litoribacillus peritrichatus]|uniref:Gfo/Idh/MocA family oxidoreductase n=1 Tax=Litoribacillus peritrichatus TaxID=718191 RepID=A0ABP7MHU3_9GAMM